MAVIIMTDKPIDVLPMLEKEVIERQDNDFREAIVKSCGIQGAVPPNRCPYYWLI